MNPVRLSIRTQSGAGGEISRQSAWVDATATPADRYPIIPGSELYQVT